MTSQLPFWLQVLTALLTPTVAIGVGVVAFLQWRTAHQKVMLDLFDRRLALFYNIVDTVNPVVRHGGPRTENSAIKFGESIRDARYLFGSEVNDYLEGFRSMLIGMALAEDMIEAHEPDRGDWISKKYHALQQVSSFYEDFPKLCDPYMRMDQKKIRTPVEWLLGAVGRGPKIPKLEVPKKQ